MRVGTGGEPETLALKSFPAYQPGIVLSGEHCLYALQSNNTIFIFGFGQGGAGTWGKPGPRALGCTETLF